MTLEKKQITETCIEIEKTFCGNRNKNFFQKDITLYIQYELVDFRHP